MWEINGKLIKTFLLLLSVLLLFFYNAEAQKVTLSGVVNDASNGETLLGAQLVLFDTLNRTEQVATLSNQAGFYTITVQPGTYIAVMLLFGYGEWHDTLTLTKNRTLNIELSHASIMADEVVVSADRADRNVSSVDVGKMAMSIETIKAMPSLMGEADVLKSVQLLPGVQSGGEGNSGFFVRGGSADQNLIMLDGATIYNPSHLFGFFSIFNANAVKNVEITKSAMPAYYGGRLASILDVSQMDGNLKQWQADGGIGVIFSNITVQGPIKKDKCSLILSGRRTYIDWLVQPFLKKESPVKGMKFYFYDLNGKLNIVINDKHRLFISGYYGSDVYGFKSQSGGTMAKFQWSNGAGTLRWNYIISPKLFLNTVATLSDYQFTTEIGMSVYNFSIKSAVRDYGLRTELTYIPTAKHNLRFGLHYIFHRILPNNYAMEAGENNNLSIPQSPPFYAHELAIYVNDEYDVARWLKLNLGLRYTHFEHVGSFVRYILDDFGYVADSVVYKPGEIVKQYNYVEPRIAARFLLGKTTAIKASYTLNFQYLHQVNMATISLPVDVWMPSTDIVKPQIGNQVSLGVYQNFHKDMFEAYIDGYYKWMQNQVEYRDGLDFSWLTINPDQMYAFGKGYSWGIEFFLKKNTGRFTGFIGYTLSYTKRQFDALNNGKPFYAKYDRRHDVTVSLNYTIIRNKLDIAAVWVFASGNKMTIPLGYYFFGGTMMTEYSERNAYTMPPYHRLDLSLTWTICKRKHFETSLNFSVYNLYNQKNPFFIFYETDMHTLTGSTGQMTDFSLNTKAYQMSLFPIIPSITWNFKIK
ncbi:MAG: TonB-dependent receptor [Bacteroidales bacterium]|jgi:outer membrane receptor for ferrienterochelin and colicin|nr:TonB-dependent receptor [Bacteroidales bacterium]